MATFMDEFSELDQDKSKIQERFPHFLQPIKNLMDNWGINIAAELEDFAREYLEHLRERVNFNECAMVVQGATNVYSKKVDHYSQVAMETLNFIMAKRQKQKKKDGEDGEQAIDDGFDDYDDVGGSGGAKGKKKGARLSHWRPVLADLTNIRVPDRLPKCSDYSISSIDDLIIERACAQQFKPLMPMCLLPLNDSEKSEVALWTTKDEAYGRKDDYRVNHCEIDHSGALLLHRDHAALIGSLDDLLQQLMGNDSTLTDSLRPRFEPRASQEQAVVPNQYDFNMDHNHEDDDDYVGGADVHDDDDTIVPNNSQMDGTVAVAARRRDPVAEFIAELEQPLDEKVWATLDPYDPGPQSMNRPIEIKKQRSKAAKRARLLRENLTRDNCSAADYDTYATTKPISQYINEEFYSARKDLPKSLQKENIYPGLEQLVIKTHKARELLFRRWAKETDKENTTPIQADQPADYDSDNADFMPDFEPDDDDMEAQQMEPAADKDQDQLLIDGAGLGMADLSEGVLGIASSSNEPPVLRTYEQLISWHLEQHVRNCGLSAFQTDLSRRVSLWQERVQLRLDDEQKRRPYDVQVYAQEIAGRLKTADYHEHGDIGEHTPHAFKDVFAGMPHWEVPRYFLSCLMLANRYHVHIDVEEESMIDAMKVTLLNKPLDSIDLDPM